MRGARSIVTSEVRESAVYELAGDEPFTMSQLAAEVGRQVGRGLDYVDLPPTAYAEAPVKTGVPAPFAEVLADSDLGSSAAN